MTTNSLNSHISSTFPKVRVPKNLANYQYVRQRSIPLDEFKWIRPEELIGLELPRPVVLVTGAFDMLSASHMRLLFEARTKAGANGTVLVAMNSDESVAERKGPGRPVLTFVERTATLAYMPVDILVEFNSEDELKYISSTVKPDLQVAGQEYMNQPTTAGVPLFCIHEGGPHTSEIIKRIKNDSIG